jgi:hypothetical protein
MPCPLMQTENKPIQAEATPPAGTGLRVQYRRNDLVFSGYRPPWWSRDGMEDPEHSLKTMHPLGIGQQSPSFSPVWLGGEGKSS